MKKNYVKPYIAVESFQLNAAIAGDCKDKGAKPINHSLISCTANEEMGIDFGYFGASCRDNVTNWKTGDGNDGFCYHGPTVDLSAMFLAS